MKQTICVALLCFLLSPLCAQGYTPMTGSFISREESGVILSSMVLDERNSDFRKELFELVSRQVDSNGDLEPAIIKIQKTGSGSGFAGDFSEAARKRFDFYLVVFKHTQWRIRKDGGGYFLAPIDFSKTGEFDIPDLSGWFIMIRRSKEADGFSIVSAGAAN